MMRFTMDDMQTPPPSAAELVHLEIQKKKQDRLMLKEERLSKTEARLEKQRAAAAKKERQRRSAEGNLRAQEAAREAELQRRAEATIDLRFDVVYAIEAAAKVVGMPVSDEQSKFLVEFVVQLRRAKVI